MVKTKTFIINLEKDKDRYTNIIKQLEKFKNNNHERIEAVYGKDLKSDYGNKLSKSQIGCFLSHIKTLFQIIEQKLDYAIILEDDVTITKWFDKIEEIIHDIYPNFDICWIGNCEGKWPRNTCNIIPNYNYNELNFVSKYLVKLDDIKTNNPVGGYGLIISKKGAYKILQDLDLLKFQNFENIQNFEIENPIDIYYINKNFDRYMTIPSIIIHCYTFGSNIGNTEKQTNPFQDVWNRFPKEEIECLEILQNLEDLLTKNDINYSLCSNTLLGFMITNKFLYYDDNIDIIIKKEDLQKFEKLENAIKKFSDILKLKEAKINGSLLYRIFCKNLNYTWPFINVFIYEYSNDSKLNILSKKTVINNVSDKTKKVKIKSNNNNLTYHTRIFNDSDKILDKLYPKWKEICFSPEFNNRKNYKNNYIYMFNCENIIPGYKLVDTKNENYEKINKFYKKIDVYFFRNVIMIMFLIFLCISLVIIFIYLLKI